MRGAALRAVGLRVAGRKPWLVAHSVAKSAWIIFGLLSVVAGVWCQLSVPALRMVVFKDSWTAFKVKRAGLVQVHASVFTAR